LTGILAEEELFKRREEELEKKQRKSQNCQVQMYGTITVGDARLKLVSRDVAEEERLQVQQERAVQREVQQKVQEEEEKIAKVEKAKVKALKKAEKEKKAKKLKEEKKKAQEVKARERAKKNKIKEAEKAKRALLKKKSYIGTAHRSSKPDSKPKKGVITRVNTKGAVKKGSRS